MDRKQTINHILSDLNTLKSQGNFKNTYALNENIYFFESIKSIPQYLKWIFTRANKLVRGNLLELTDFPFPKWDKEMHKKLVETEKKDFPGLIRPLVDSIIDSIIKQNDARFIGVGLGCGGMEVERQVLKNLINKKYKNQVILIGVDNSDMAQEVAKENLIEIEPDIDIHKVEHLTHKTLEDILKNESNRHVIIMCKNDIFRLKDDFSPKSFHLMYHSLFKHHLKDEYKKSLDSTMENLSKKTLEYDGFRSWSVIIPQTIVGWKYPVFLNAEIFSNFRYYTKKEIKALYSKSILSFSSKLGTYLRK